MSATSTPTPAETPLLLRSSDLGSGAASTADGSTPEDRLDGVSPSIKRRLYTSHFLSTFNSRAFEFGAVLYLASIFPNTLLPLSVYALSRGASVIVFSSAVGWYIDVGNRLQVVRSSIIFQRLAVVASCAVFWALETEWASGPVSKNWLLALLIVLASVEKLCSIICLISVERDWVVVIAQDNKESLRALNSQMRRIDLTCKLAGPFAMALLEAGSTRVAILVNLAMSLLSVFAEYFTIARVYKLVPELQASKQPLVEAASGTGGDSQREVWLLRAPRLALRRLKAYFQHRAAIPSFACALLYFTVLSFAGQMVTYLLSAGYNSFHIGIARTVSVVAEISATWIAPVVMARIGPIRSGMWFLSWQMMALAGAASGFLGFKSEILAATCLVCGTILSRAGLWGFDLSVQVIVQEEVEPDRRGSFASTEVSWQNTFELCSYAMTIIFSQPEQFHWPVLMSCVAVFAGGGLYVTFVRLRRGHIFHLPECIEVKGNRRFSEESGYERLDYPFTIGERIRAF